MKEEIRQYALNLGIDDIGFARAENYISPKSYELGRFMPSVKSIVVMIHKELSGCESPSSTIAMNGRLDLNSFQRSCCYRLARFIEDRFGGKVASMPYSSPMELPQERLGLADFSQRHAALAAGLGTLGRHNLLLHPRFGTRVAITSLLTNLDIPADAMIKENLCINCDLCVKNCPAHALDEAGKTDVPKCVANSQPYGMRTNIVFWKKFAASSPEEQKEMIGSEEFRRIGQAHSIGMQYYCFNCMQVCPVGKKPGA